RPIVVVHCCCTRRQAHGTALCTGFPRCVDDHVQRVRGSTAGLGGTRGSPTPSSTPEGGPSGHVPIPDGGRMLLASLSGRARRRAHSRPAERLRRVGRNIVSSVLRSLPSVVRGDTVLLQA